jgi:hypothetical protein
MVSVAYSIALPTGATSVVGRPVILSRPRMISISGPRFCAGAGGRAGSGIAAGLGLGVTAGAGPIKQTPRPMPSAAAHGIFTDG